MTLGMFGRKCGDSFAYYDRDTSSLRTCQATFPWASEMSYPTLPPSGLMQNGVLFPLRMWEPPISARGCLAWPTPAARDYRSGKASQETMQFNARPLNEAVETGTKADGMLNPDWVCTLMGLPVGWAKPDGPPLRATSSTTGSHPEPAKATPDGSPN